MGAQGPMASMGHALQVTIPLKDPTELNFLWSMLPECSEICNIGRIDESGGVQGVVGWGQMGGQGPMASMGGLWMAGHDPQMMAQQPTMPSQQVPCLAHSEVVTTCLAMHGSLHVSSLCPLHEVICSWYRPPHVKPAAVNWVPGCAIPSGIACGLA